MYSIRRQLVAGIMAVTLVGAVSTAAPAQPQPKGAESATTGPAPEPKRAVFTKESLPQLLKQLGYNVTEKSLANGRLYWQISAQANEWRFNVRVLPFTSHEKDQEKITCLLLSSELGGKIGPKADAEALLKLMQWNHDCAYLMYFSHSTQTGCITMQRPYNFADATPDELRMVFEEMFKYIRETHSLWGPLSGNAATPAEASGPAPKAAVVKNLAGSTWTGKEELSGFGKLTFVFGDNGTATMIDARNEVAGTWTQNGNDVTIRFEDCVYQGRLSGQTLTGSGRFTGGEQQGKTWSFEVRMEKS